MLVSMASDWLDKVAKTISETPLKEILAASDRRLCSDPETRFWSQWHRAWTLRLLERWQEAAAACERMGADDFKDLQTWQYEHLLASRAYCLARAHAPQAEEAFDALLRRYESNPELAAHARFGDLRAMASLAAESVPAKRAMALLAKHAPGLVEK